MSLLDLANWLPILLLIWFFWWIVIKAVKQERSGTPNHHGSLLPPDSRASGRFLSINPRRYTPDQIKVTFNDVAGVHEATRSFYRHCYTRSQRT